MAVNPWPAGDEVMRLMTEVKVKHHDERLGDTTVAMCFDDSKPFKKGKFNWGKAMKFSPIAKLFQHKDKKVDFLIILCVDAWHEVLTGNQREALIDLHLSRFQPEYLPNFIEENGKKKPVKDKWGRIEYSKDVKRDEEGNIIWKVEPLDLFVLSDNVRRYGPWCEELKNFREAIQINNKFNEPKENVYEATPTTAGLFRGGWRGLRASADVEFKPNN